MKILKKTTHLWIKQAVKLVQSARQEVVKHTNSLIVVTYFHLGKLIVEQEQKGSTKATYGQEVIKKLSDTLTKQFGKGFSDDNLENMRLFYLLYKRKTGLSEISETLSRKSLTVKRTKSISASKPLSERLSKTSIQNIFPLSWSHYVTLIRIKNKQERAFYEIEARQNNWSVRELKRQYDSGLFERLLISKDKKKVRQLAAKGQVIEKPEDVIKSKYILEFLGMEEATY